jgi:FtsH ternary system domain X3-analog
MAEVTIHLRCDPETGKKDIVVSLRSDEDALPHEHEQQHKAIVDRLIEGGIVKAGEVGKVVVEREEEAKEPPVPAGHEPQGERRAQQQGH